MTDGATTGKIFNIQKYSLYDGPGIRTLLFMKGCPLRCKWCANPESISTAAQLMFVKRLCTNCGKCVSLCPNKVHVLETKDGMPHHSVDRTATCQGCKACEQYCPNSTLSVAGWDITVEEAMEIIRQDAPFYWSSGGGVTIGGGEPTTQHRFVTEVLARCKAEGINTALETCGYAEWDVMKQFVGKVDHFLFDIKHIDPEEHRKLTGRSNDKILNNLENLIAAGAKINIRLPMIKGSNDSPEVLRRTMSYISKLYRGSNIMGIDILPYHKLGVSKYDQLDMTYGIDEDISYKDGELDRIGSLVSGYDMPVKIIRH